jgi:hypothetical protein
MYAHGKITFFFLKFSMCVHYLEGTVVLLYMKLNNKLWWLARLFI